MIRCAICNRIKQTFNHWWTLAYNKETKSLFEYPFLEDDPNEFPPGVYTKIYLCGIEHLLIAESKIRSGVDPVRRIPE